MAFSSDPTSPKKNVYIPYCWIAHSPRNSQSKYYLDMQKILLHDATYKNSLQQKDGLQPICEEHFSLTSKRYKLMALLRSLATEQGCFLRKPWACKYSVLKLFHMQNGKIRKCISINWKVQKEKKKCID